MKTSTEAIAVKNEYQNNGSDKARTTIGIRMITKDKLDKNRAPGQCYDGFIRQMVDLWERNNGNGNDKQ